MPKNNGGYAFARPIGAVAGVVEYAQEGMTMRQYYKAAVVQGLMANGGIYPGQAIPSNQPENIASLVSMIADAMILEDIDAKA